MNKSERKVILNKVFPNASYMIKNGDNIGHETVNLFKSNGGYYIHLNPNGTYNGKDPVDVLNLSHVGIGLYQVVSKAVNCKKFDGADIIGLDKGEIRYKKQAEEIYYGYYEKSKQGIPVCKYFENNVTMQGKEEKDLFVTFTCDGIYEAKQPIYVAFSDSKRYDDDSIKNFYLLNDKKAWRSACRIKNIEGDDLKKLQSMVCDNTLWETDPLPSFEERYMELKKKSQKEEENYFSFLGVDKQELQYSNALIKILKFKPQFLSDFLKKLSNKDCENNDFDILREEKSIDLLFRDLDKENGKIFIIENKIDASVTLSEYGMKLEEQVEKWIRIIDNIKKDAPLNKEQGKLKDDIFKLVGSSKGKEASQLSKYYVVAVYWALKAGWCENKIKEDICCYFLCPEYHRFNYKTKNGRLDINLALSEQYQLTTYKDILNIFDNFSSNGLTDHQKFLLNDFISAISILAKERDDSMELKMIRLFIERYEKIKTEA